ncbi:MAG: alpha-D-ribose 1-methylphosphonate 5-triphosphate diphosphatase [Roseateles asaccharophilus]|uniref:Alpha-D-ribose 1-methylphosphonate 5-triphosphate diphosphatase n=1 Tax=Roseateles asaccharophilus TaxID=582607 RepID=A0A4R6NB42_9BURK|nr:alpha-D-ribose 1-methylphosphonate 5-triphosphate diphosphatase [Roseateles asaccharophilus]MDN3543335.1 alpha-D-ribose 1-methylphosphonate 5-triphosphate diphosphatase [Roseateles asaccharophilus]TDP12966.1 alpha-D-ribose 1-methylphosphonate 5-triphosphate diphosphatase [Roseateles asaccharophilus]
MSHSRIIHNARLVLANETVQGQVLIEDGRIAAIDTGRSALPAAEDWGGDWLLPGLVEIHTDNLERHVTPRPKIVFPMLGAVQAHDAELASAGISTVFDAIGVGDPYGEGFRARSQAAVLEALDRLEAAGALRADHLVHIRCELPAPNARELFEPFASHPRLKLLSLMDHTPGQRQWNDIAHARVYYTGKKGWSDAQFDEEVRIAPQRQAQHAQPNRLWFSEFARQQGLALATHDDTTTEHVDEARALGACMSEFPTTLVAARRARELGLATVAGAPNVIRGGSHSGNVSALELAREGVLDMLSSDYVPSSLLQAAWVLQREAGFSPSEALAIVSLNPARACGLHDRGQIAIGLRADVLRVAEVDGFPVVRELSVLGRRVA